MRTVAILLLLVAILILTEFLFSSKDSMALFRNVQFTTSDGVKIVGNYYPVKNSSQVVLMLHMMPATKESWDRLAQELQKKDISSLAIDLRGHGESVNQGDKHLNYQDFTHEEHQASRRDVEAALGWLKNETGLGLDHMSVIGASIGANLALQALAQYPEIKRGVALSPGLNYRGIEPKPLVSKLVKGQAVLYATSKDDEDNALMTEELFNATSSKKEWKVYDTAGHGTMMLERISDLSPSIIEFLIK